MKRFEMKNRSTHDAAITAPVEFQDNAVTSMFSEWSGQVRACSKTTSCASSVSDSWNPAEKDSRCPILVLLQQIQRMERLQTVEGVASPILLQFLNQTRNCASDELRKLGRVIVADFNLFFDVVVGLDLKTKKPRRKLSSTSMSGAD